LLIGSSFNVSSVPMQKERAAEGALNRVMIVKKVQKVQRLL
jgi:hypothetical protein